MILASGAWSLAYALVIVLLVAVFNFFVWASLYCNLARRDQDKAAETARLIKERHKK